MSNAEHLVRLVRRWKKHGVVPPSPHRPSSSIRASITYREDNFYRIEAGAEDVVTFFATDYEHRLAVTREDHGVDHGWAELQSIKHLIWGDVPAIEVFPVQADLLDGTNTRHLWRLDADTYRRFNICSHGRQDGRP